MEVRYLPDQESYRHLTTQQLRSAFLFDGLFVPGVISTTYCDVDRMIVGGALPLEDPLTLQATRKEMAASYFTERREVGIVNIGGRGRVTVDGVSYEMAHNDMVYVGRGTKSVTFTSADRALPAVFYFVSYPAHASFPSKVIRYAEAQKTPLGSPEGANLRTIHKFIHSGGVQSCQLVMGLTTLESGSIWNTMPPHTHMRRSEVYLYYELDPASIVVHMMGTPDQTRSLIVRDRQAVLSPSWSIHCGAGTRNYSFIWAMGGENQEFSDMDAVDMKDIL
jgi:4-deoxy-L-threo-5-hexosulose-uronate ketol-isomerase